MSYSKITNNSTERDRVVYPFCFYRDLFKSDDIADVLKFTASLDTEDSYIGVGGPGTINKAVRNSQTRFFMPSEESKFIFNRINDGVEWINNHFYDFDLVGYDSIQYTAYSGSSTSFYNWHTDAGFGQPNEHHRKLSIVVMLSTPDKDFFGGDFQITQGDPDGEQQTVKFEQGMMIAFPSYLMHRVTPVTQGLRQTLVTWVTGPKFR